MAVPGGIAAGYEVGKIAGKGGEAIYDAIKGKNRSLNASNMNMKMFDPSSMAKQQVKEKDIKIMTLPPKELFGDDSSGSEDEAPP
jgi:hypothetical protein